MLGTLQDTPRFPAAGVLFDEVSIGSDEDGSHGRMRFPRIDLNVPGTER